MRGKVVCIFSVVLLWCVFVFPKESSAFILISEIFADPATNLTGDSNQDGVSSSTQDEFIEIFNNYLSAVDISGWSIKDSTATRHVFPNSTVLNPLQYLVIFGGGAPNIPEVFWQKSSTGGLSLNNTGDTVSIYDNQNQLVDQIVYGAIGGQDQSIVRTSLEKDASLALYSSLPDANGEIFSPGRGQEVPAASTVPENNTWVYFSLLSAVALFRKHLFI